MGEHSKRGQQDGQHWSPGKDTGDRRCVPSHHRPLWLWVSGSGQCKGQRSNVNILSERPKARQQASSVAAAAKPRTTVQRLQSRQCVYQAKPRPHCHYICHHEDCQPWHHKTHHLHQHHQVSALCAHGNGVSAVKTENKDSSSTCSLLRTLETETLGSRGSQVLVFIRDEHGHLRWTQSPTRLSSACFFTLQGVVDRIQDALATLLCNQSKAKDISKNSNCIHHFKKLNLQTMHKWLCSTQASTTGKSFNHFNVPFSLSIKPNQCCCLCNHSSNRHFMLPFRLFID